jgi:hypothetical protein
MKDPVKFIRRLILLVWALWSAVVTLSNFFDVFRSLGMLPDWFKFVSGNFGYIQSATSIYLFPVWLNAVLFGLVIILEALMSYHFFKAFAGVNLGREGVVYTPFVFGLSLFGGFLVTDELLIAYDRLGSIEQTHLAIFVAMMVSLLAVTLLPQISSQSKSGNNSQ